MDSLTQPNIIISEITNTLKYFNNKYTTDENYTHNELLTEFNESKWLVLSSLFFMAPAIYAYNYGLYIPALIQFIASILSANYWRNATYTWRRKLDHFFAKVTFIYFLLYGILYVKNISSTICGYVLIPIIIYLYYLSCKNDDAKQKCWIKYHMLFHVFVVFGYFNILYSVVNY